MSYIDNTWVAYAFDEPVSPDAIDAAMERVRAHCDQLYAEPLTEGSRASATVGMALWRREDPRLRWPPRRVAPRSPRRTASPAGSGLWQGMWREATAGEGHSHYEAAFMRIAWRVCFADHARRLAELIPKDEPVFIRRADAKS